MLFHKKTFAIFKRIVFSCLSYFSDIKLKREKGNLCWVSDVQDGGHVDMLAYNQNPAISKGGYNDKVLKEGPISPSCIPPGRVLSAQASLSSPEYLYKVDKGKLLGRVPFLKLKNKIIKDSVFFSDEHDRVGRQIKSNYTSDFVDMVKFSMILSSKKRAKKDIHDAVLLFSKWNHYGHWVPEHLLKLKNLTDVLEEDAFNVNVIIEKDAPRWKFQYLNVLGWSDDKIIEWDVKSANVYNFYCPSYPMPSYEGYRWLKGKILKAYPLDTENSFEKIYLSRNKFGSRGVKNESELISFLKSKGFKILYPEFLSLEEQFNIFSNAKVVVGPHGSAFTNIIFSEDAKIVEFFGHHVPLGFYCYAQVMGHDYRPLFCESGLKKDDYMTVDLDELEKIFLSLEI